MKINYIFVPDNNLKQNQMTEFKITKEQIKELAYFGDCGTEYKLKEWFPEAFETKLETGKWYINGKCLFNFSGNYDMDNHPTGYGFDTDGIFIPNNTKSGWGFDKATPATDSEVEAALINEAKKRGFKEGVCVSREWMRLETKRIIDKSVFPMKNNFHYDINEDYLECFGFVVYSKGKWAEIIPTMTKQEAEEKLGVKICD